MPGQAWIAGAGNTRFGRLDGRGPLELMGEAAQHALADAGLRPSDIDGVLCGYATTLPHLMLATLLAERLAITPRYAHGLQLGGATGGAMLMLARELVLAGRCRRVLVVAGENRLSGHARDSAIQTLAQVGDAELEVPNGASVPAYYALLASRYQHEHGLSEADLAEFAVLMRAHAASHPDAHLRDPITVAQVLASKPIASPLKLLDCCPISDGAMALVVTADRPGASGSTRAGGDAGSGAGAGPAVAITGAGQAHRHQHLSAIADTGNFGALDASRQALAEAGCTLDDIDYLAIYDSFTITLAILLEEIGFAPRGRAAARLRAGDFSRAGALPLNTHGGLLSFGHSGVAGGMAHAVEAWRQLAGRAGDRQLPPRRCAFFHADGGVMSSHVSLVLQRQD